MRLTPICVTCKKEMKCLKNQVNVIHFLNDDRKNGIDFVIEGDKYGCACGNEIITGFGAMMLAIDLSKYLKELILSKEYIEIKRR